MAGNANSGPKREKPFLNALNMELAAAGKDHKKLRAIAAQLISKAENGDLQAIMAISDRTDGRPHQSMDASIEHEVGSELKSLLEAINGRTRGIPNSG